MSEIHYLWLVPGLPLLAAVIIGLFGPGFLRQHSHWPCVLSIAGSCVVSLFAFAAVWGRDQKDLVFVNECYTWIAAGRTNVPFALRADALSTMMAVMVTFIATFIATYAIGYMHNDPGYPRFFAEVSLFVTAMTLLVLSDNFVLLYVGWEGVGLCSYLLIGFWFQKPSAADAARKAFLLTRIGDVGLFLGILLLWFHFGSVEYTTIFAGIEQEAQKHPGLMLAAALLIFCGAAGKSAQFPFHVWLPDAMEGPTPVSALIHAATMVTAGVYLVARCTPLFVAAPGAQLTVASIGGFTALLAALIALTQNDLKRVLAYSTLSQLGYMFLALGCALGHKGGGEPWLVTFAVVAAMFHLFTHAFFKALLFLAAGSVMHGMGNVVDMRRFGGLRAVMPRTHVTFLCGALALAGVPLLSGFWSKDEILDACAQASKSPQYGGVYLLLLVVGVVTAGLTAFYTFRAYFMTFWGKLVVPPEAHGHGHGAHGGHGGHGGAESHESPAVMTVPLMVLAVFAVGVGAVLGPTHLFAHYLELTPGLPKEPSRPMNFPLMAISSAFALGGVALAWLMYVKQPELPARLARSAQALYQLSLNKFYLDELYSALIVQPAQTLAQALRGFDFNLIDGLVDLTGHLPRWVAGVFRPVQNGLVQFYALAMILGLTVFLLALVRSL